MDTFNTIAKNLLLGNNCWNCKHCACLATIEWFEKMDEKRFKEMAGFSKQEIHENTIAFGAVWECNSNVLPEDITCLSWRDGGY